jgi:urease accessory protein
MSATLLLLADGRLPSGGHAHSGGFEPVAGLVGGLDDLRSFLLGRLHTVGLISAAVAAIAVSSDDLEALDAEVDARTPSPAAREASRKQGRQLLRAARTVWPSAVYDGLPVGPHHPVVLGVASAAAGLTAAGAALAAAHGAVTGAASAAVRLQSLDPLAVHAVLASLSGDVDAVAAAAVACREIPDAAAPRLEIAAEDHATWEVRLFAS